MGQPVIRKSFRQLLRTKTRQRRTSLRIAYVVSQNSRTSKHFAERSSLNYKVRNTSKASYFCISVMFFTKKSLRGRSGNLKREQEECARARAEDTYVYEFLYITQFISHFGKVYTYV